MTVPYWRLSAFYFFYFATLGGFLPFWSLYLDFRGFTALQIGELSALMVATKIVAPNLWGWIADHTGRSMRMIRMASLMGALIFSAFLVAEGYQIFALITVGFSFFWNAALPQFEAATLSHLHNDSYRYSRIRLWGSVGFIVTVLGIGHLLDYYSIAYLTWAVTLLLSMIWLVAMITPEAGGSMANQDGIGIWRILGRSEVVAFLLVYMLLQLAHGPYYVFYSIYLKQQGYTATETGLLWALGVCAEILLFLGMKPLLAKISLRRILLVSILLSILRWWLIAHFPRSQLIMITAQCLHAATFGSSHVAAIHLVHQYFGRHHQGKGQALYSSMSFGLGGMLGSLYSGYLWDEFGAEFVYTMASAVCCLAFACAFIWVGREKKPLLG